MLEDRQTDARTHRHDHHNTPLSGVAPAPGAAAEGAQVSLTGNIL